MLILISILIISHGTLKKGQKRQTSARLQSSSLSFERRKVNLLACESAKPSLLPLVSVQYNSFHAYDECHQGLSV